jgi:hypothetical protein
MPLDVVLQLALYFYSSSVSDLVIVNNIKILQSLSTLVAFEDILEHLRHLLAFMMFDMCSFVKLCFNLYLLL